MPTGDGFDVRSLAITLRTGAALGLHRHPWGQLVFACSGAMRVATNAATWLVPATRAIWVPAGIDHRIEIQGEVAMRTLYIAPHRADTLWQQPTSLRVEPLLRELIVEIVRTGMLHPAHPEQDRLAGVLIDRLLHARSEDLFLPLPKDPRAFCLAAHIQANPGDGRDLAAIAQTTGASIRTLQRLFPRETGMTLEAWRQKARLIHAVSRLTAGASVTDTAFDCAYQSVGAFIAAFSRQFGVTPGRY
jgi:AraC-like DNA-binding protein/quercetin dioxygenase-like cupin family protein